MNQKADHRIDLRGFIFPIALLKASQAFREMLPEQILEIVCHDLDTKNDLLKIIPSYACELILAEETDDGSAFRFQMKKTQA